MFKEIKELEGQYVFHRITFIMWTEKENRIWYTVAYGFPLRKASSQIRLCQYFWAQYFSSLHKYFLVINNNSILLNIVRHTKRERISVRKEHEYILTQVHPGHISKPQELSHIFHLVYIWKNYVIEILCWNGSLLNTCL